MVKRSTNFNLFSPFTLGNRPDQCLHAFTISCLNRPLWWPYLRTLSRPLWSTTMAYHLTEDLYPFRPPDISNSAFQLHLWHLPISTPSYAILQAKMSSFDFGPKIQDGAKKPFWKWLGFCWFVKRCFNIESETKSQSNNLLGTILNLYIICNLHLIISDYRVIIYFYTFYVRMNAENFQNFDF